jgi:hypothetical protein
VGGNMIKFSVYDELSGRCRICGEDTLWGDAPHKPDCEFAKRYLGDLSKENTESLVKKIVFNTLDKMRTPIIIKRKF